MYYCALGQCEEVSLFKVRLIEIAAGLSLFPYMDYVLRRYLCGSNYVIIGIGDSIAIQYYAVSNYAVPHFPVKIRGRQIKIAYGSQLQYVVSYVVIDLVSLEQAVNDLSYLRVISRSPYYISCRVRHCTVSSVIG